MTSPSRPRGAAVLRWAPVVVLTCLQLGAWGSFFSGGMRAVLAWLALMTIVPIVGGLCAMGAGVYVLLRRRLSAPIGITFLLSAPALWPGAWSLNLGHIAFPSDRATTTPAATVRLPSDHSLRVCWGGDRIATNYHAFTPDQRWAYDLVIEPYFGGGSDLKGYGCYGTPVVAPIGAKIHFAHDGEPDAEPGKASTEARKPLGNHVVFALPSGTYLVIAHLQSGSVAVKAGDLVPEGQVIGRCGNSGNTSEPHIHIHHQRQDPATHPTNFAEGLPLYFRDHDGKPMPEGGLEVRGDRIVALGDVVRHQRPKREGAPPPPAATETP